MHEKRDKNSRTTLQESYYNIYFRNNINYFQKISDSNKVQFSIYYRIIFRIVFH